MERNQEGNKGVHVESLQTGGSEGADYHFSLMRFDMGLEFRLVRYTIIIERGQFLPCARMRSRVMRLVASVQVCICIIYICICYNTFRRGYKPQHPDWEVL